MSDSSATFSGLWASLWRVATCKSSRGAARHFLWSARGSVRRIMKSEIYLRVPHFFRSWLTHNIGLVIRSCRQKQRLERLVSEMTYHVSNGT